MKKIILGALLMSYSMNAQLSEGFEDIIALSGWSFVNVSTLPPFEGNGWFQGNDEVFPAYDGEATSYLGTNFNASGCCTISNWAILPVLTLSNGDTVSFYTRTIEDSQYPDRLEIRMSTQGAASQAPFDEEDVGSYVHLLDWINPNLEIGGYPEEWELQSAQVSGLSGPTDIRIALRYYVTDGGLEGSNSNYIGIDQVRVRSQLGVEDEEYYGFKYSLASNGKLSLSASIPLTGVEVYDVFGKRVVMKDLKSTNEVLFLDHLSVGMYILKVHIDGTTISKKIGKT